MTYYPLELFTHFAAACAALDYSPGSDRSCLARDALLASPHVQILSSFQLFHILRFVFAL